MDQAPESRIGVRDPSIVGSMHTLEPTISCVLPWQGSAAALRHHVLAVLDDISALVRFWELILVDDGCVDAAVLRWTEVEGVRVLRLTRRCGRDAAIAAGLQHAHGDLVVVLQGDDPSASELIAGLLVKWRQGFDVVVATQPPAHVPPPLSTRLARRLRAASGVGAPRIDPTLMRTAHRALLIDRGVLAHFALPPARATASGARQQALLKMATVPIPPSPGAGACVAGSADGYGIPSSSVLGVIGELGRSLTRWRTPSTLVPTFEIQEELGTGLPPRTSPSPYDGQTLHAPAGPDA